MARPRSAAGGGLRRDAGMEGAPLAPVAAVMQGPDGGPEGKGLSKSHLLSPPPRARRPGRSVEGWVPCGAGPRPSRPPSRSWWRPAGLTSAGLWPSCGSSLCCSRLRSGLSCPGPGSLSSGPPDPDGLTEVLACVPKDACSTQGPVRSFQADASLGPTVQLSPSGWWGCAPEQGR